MLDTFLFLPDTISEALRDDLSTGLRAIADALDARNSMANSLARVRQQVDDAVRNVEAQRRQAELAKRARELTALQLQAELARLQAGRSSNFQVVSFQAALQSAESAELQAVIGYLNALTTLDQVLGTTLDTWRIELNQG